jgi:organic radical activating enzyme
MPMLNTQFPEKPVHTSGDTLEVHSIFHTLQGEGPYAGVPAVFVRLAGCNLQCPRCDTNYTDGRYVATVEAIVQDIWAKREPTTRLVVITGGEPFRQTLKPFVKLLLFSGFQVQIETNGTLHQDLPYEDIMVVCSPKTGSLNRFLVPKLAALKYVVSADAMDEDNYPTYALESASYLFRPPVDFQGTIYFQPYDSGSEEENQRHRQAAVKACFATGNTLCLQTHKLLNLE